MYAQSIGFPLQRRTLDSINTARSNLENSITNLEVSHQLVDGAKDVLSLSLDAQACPHRVKCNW